jgi:anti-anti-sigma factor
MTWLCSPLLVLEVEVSQDTATVVITGELDLTTRPALIEQLSAVLCTRPRRLVVDMAGTAFIDCGSARLIVSASRFLPRGSCLVIRRPSSAVRRVFELTGLPFPPNPPCLSPIPPPERA